MILMSIVIIFWGQDQPQSEGRRNADLTVKLLPGCSFTAKQTQSSTELYVRLDVLLLVVADAVAIRRSAHTSTMLMMNASLSRPGSRILSDSDPITASHHHSSHASEQSPQTSP